MVKCSCSAPYIDPASVAPCIPAVPRHALKIYWFKMLELFLDYKPKEAFTRENEELSDAHYAQHVAPIERCNYSRHGMSMCRMWKKQH